MREHKYRVWDEQDKKMSQVVSLDEIVSSMPEELFGKYLLHPYKWQQYTGLHDKNGKEICEGDWIDIRDAYTGDSFTDLRVVVYNSHTACFTLRWQRFAKSEDDFMHAELFREYHPDKYTKQVIGNIYENPELLEAK